jgi:hypothetical protein
VGLQKNMPAVVSEAIDGEVIVIHLERGSYFSLRDTAAELWELVEQGCASETIVEAMSARYSSARADEVAREATRFLGELKEEGLVVDADGAAVEAPDLGSASADFAPPQLEKYTDLQDLIMMDPIHEVEPEGWPAPRESA